MNIYITLDYELFLGKESGTVENCLIRPINEYISLLNKYNIFSTIFVDAAYLYRLNQLKTNNLKLKNDYEKVLENIRLLDKEGHSIQLHFHPQWLYSEYENGKWKMDLLHYKLSDIPKSELFIKFKEAKELLDSIIGCKTHAFRAGGFCIQTFDDFPILFFENNIKLDSSVLRDAFEKNSFQDYDYRIIPNKHLYKFSSDVTIENENGEFQELTISTKKIYGLLYMILRWYYIFKSRKAIIYGDGLGIGLYDNKRNKITTKLNKSLNYHLLPVVIDSWLSYFLPKKIQKNSDDLVILGHPKSFTNISLQNLERFIKNNIDSNNFLTIEQITL